MLSFEYIQIEPTFNCNLLCRHCGRLKRYVGKEMSLEGLQFVLDQFKKHKVDHIAFGGGGEIFTLEKYEEMLSLIAKRGYRVSTVSNGTLLHKKNMDYIIKNSLLFHIIFSMEGATRKTFESIRGDNTFDIFVNNIKKIRDLKNKWNTPYPVITLNVVCMKENLKELPMIVDFAKHNGIKEVFFVHLNPLIKAPQNKIKNKLCVPEQHLLSCDLQEVKRVFQEIKKKSNGGYFNLMKFPNIENTCSELKTISKEKKTYCPWIQKRTFINWEGFVLPCCMVGRDVINFGNIFQKNFQDIWDSPQFKEFRTNLSNGNPHSICRNCNEYREIGFG